MAMNKKDRDLQKGRDKNLSDRGLGYNKGAEEKSKRSDVSENLDEDLDNSRSGKSGNQSHSPNRGNNGKNR